MPLFRLKLFSQPQSTTFWHVTKTEYLPSILKNGLQAKYSTEHKDNASSRTGLPNKDIANKRYLSRTRDFLPMKVEPGKTLLRIEIPNSEIKKYPNVGDPYFLKFKTMDEMWEDQQRLLLQNDPDYFKKHSMEKLKDRYMNFDRDRFMKEVYVVDRDIPPSWIRVEESN